MFDLSARLKNRVQISSDSMQSYAAAVERGFGSGVDYGQIVKTYASDDRYPQGKYSAPEVVSVEKSVIMGSPRESLISTSHVEKQITRSACIAAVLLASRTLSARSSKTSKLQSA